MSSRIRRMFAFRCFPAHPAGRTSTAGWIAVLAVLVLALPGLHGVSSAQPIHEFAGADGSEPSGELVQGRDGLLYGWTAAGGTFGKGTLFRLAPDGTGFQTLHAFAGNSLPPDGEQPGRGALVEGAPGVFYGTTGAGGLFGLGALFKLDVSGPSPTVTTLYSFSSTEAHPVGGVMIGSDGALYGTTLAGGNGYGTVFRVGRDGQGFTVLHAFSGTFISGEGIRPLATVIEASDGWLYGTTSEGSSGNVGTIFRLPKSGLVFQTIVTALPGVPETTLVEVPGPTGPRLYGVTRADNALPTNGSLFRVALDGTSFELLWDFPTNPQPSSYSPAGRLLLGRDGNLYGTTSQPDDPACSAVGCGSVFRLGAGAPALTRPFTLRAFDGPGGRVPVSGLIQGIDGHLYGTTIGGGGADLGVVFAVPNPAAAPVAFTGPATADDGGTAAYQLTLQNQTGLSISGPFVVSLTVSPGLTRIAGPPSAEWACAPTTAGYSCEWTPPTTPAELAPGASSETLNLLFTVGPGPFAPDCGLAPSPCATITATLTGHGGAVTATSTVRTLHPITGQWNQPPVAVDDLGHVDGTNPTNIDVLANDTDPDGDTLSLTAIVVPPAFGSVTFTAGGTVSYTPHAVLTAPDTFRYRVADSQGASVIGIARVFPQPGQPGVGRARIDLGAVAVGRLAAGRVSVTGTAGLSGAISFEPMTPAEITAALAGTAHDPSRAVSDPGAFRSDGWSSVLPPATPEALLYFRPSSTDVGRVSVARAVFDYVAGFGSAPVSLVIIGASADPAVAPVRARDDAASTWADTDVEIDVSANDQGPSGGAVYPAMLAPACVNLEDVVFNGQPCVAPAGGTARLVLRDLGTGLRPVAVAFQPQVGFSGVERVYYGSSDVNPCGGVVPCDTAGNVYFAAVEVTVAGAAQDQFRGTIGATVMIPYELLLANDAPGVTYSGLVDPVYGRRDYVEGPTYIINGWNSNALFVHHYGTTAETIVFTYEVMDASGHLFPSTVQVLVNNRRPVAVDVSIPVVPGQPNVIQWADIVGAPGNADPDGDAIVLSSYQLIPAPGELIHFGAVAGPGYLRFTPNPDYDGSYSFQYSVVDLADLGGARHYDGVGTATLRFPLAGAPQPARVDATLSWSREAGPGPIVVGDVVRLIGVLTNASSSVAHSPAVRFVLPADMGAMSFLPQASSPPWTCIPSPALDNGSAGTPGVSVTCTGPDMDPGRTWAIAVLARVLAAPASGTLAPTLAAGNSDCDPAQAAGVPVCSSTTGSIPVTPDTSARIGFDGGEVLLMTSLGHFRAAQGQPLSAFQGTPPPPGVTLPYGVMGFEIAGLPVGATVTVVAYLPNPATSYWKYQANTWSQFSGSTLVGNANGLVLTLVDGGVGDEDGVANGVIVDPGGPVEIAGPPTADAGPDQVVEASSPAGAGVTLTGAGGDPDGGDVTFTWSGACGSASGNPVALACPIGTTVVTLTVTDTTGLTATDEVEVLVVDTTPPAIAIGEPADGAVYVLNQQVLAAFSCSDGGSGIASCTGSVADGSALDTASIGTKTFTVTAVDAAGRQASVTRTYTVQFAAPGPCFVSAGHTILPPIAPNGSSVFWRGLPVPVRFRACDAAGRSVNTPGVVSSFAIVETRIGGVVDSQARDVPSMLSPASFYWDPVSRAWFYLVDTRGLRAGTYTFRLTLADRSTIDFRFTLR